MIAYGLDAQEVAHSNVDNAVDTSLRALLLVLYRRVRKKLRSTAQLLAHFVGCFPSKLTQAIEKPRPSPRFTWASIFLARTLMSVRHPPGDFASRAPSFI